MSLAITIFGSQGAAQVLLYLQNYGEGHARGTHLLLERTKPVCRGAKSVATEYA